MLSFNLVFVFLYTLCSVVLVSFFPQPNRWKALLITSLAFYYLLIGNSLFLLILLAALIHFSSARLVKGRQKLGLTVLLLLIPLVLYKLADPGSHFQNYQSSNLMLSDWSSLTSLFQIIGLSYFTFNGISYLIDLKRGYIERENNFFLLLLYLLYFPTIFSGPLHRAKYIFEQFKSIEISDSSISKGLRLILWGLFKTTVIAQRAYELLNKVLKSDIDGVYYLLCGLLFFIYLYCNFSAFVDLFQGVSQIFGIKLKNNFKNRIYLASSRQEFWKGWHITLNEWFRDYFFFVAIKYDQKRKYTNWILLITFLLIALWHELTIVLLIWGSLNGIWIILEKKVAFSQWKYPQLRKVGGTIYHTFLASLLALVFISSDLKLLIFKVFSNRAILPVEFKTTWLLTIVILLMSFLIMDYHYLKAKSLRFDDYLGHKSSVNRWLIYIKLTLMILLFGVSGQIDNYYTQF